MIINCRQSSPREVKVIWSKNRKDFRNGNCKEKSFFTFANANGFAMGLQKRGMFVEYLYIF